MPPGEDTATVVAVVVARLDDVRDDIAQLRTALEDSSRDKVSRGEWGQRNAHVDSRILGLGGEVADLRAEHRRDVAELRTEIASRRTPWPTTAAVVVAVASFAWTVFGP